jgi:hypothetical protein
VSQPLPKTLAIAAAACGVISIVTRPFLFGPIGLIFLLVSAKMIADRKYTGTAAVILMLGAFAGTAVAAAFTKPLY